MRRIILQPGHIVVSKEPVALETILGSCVSVCLWDDTLQAGGMNHFVLPECAESSKDLSARCGREAIEQLISDCCSIGMDLQRIKAKIFGGGRVIEQFSDAFDIGEKNIMIAREVLLQYKIPVIKEFTGPDHGLKIIFYTATGKAFVKKLDEK
ncbi:MAG: chemotaxis protein CheD [Nitrospirota bacterium]